MESGVYDDGVGGETEADDGMVGLGVGVMGGCH